MKFRKLRIAWSVVWGLAAVLLVVLWVQSYWWFNHAQYIFSNNRFVALIAVQGVVSVFGGTFDAPVGVPVESSISSRKVWFETDYWKSQHWYFDFDEPVRIVRAPLWFLVAACGGISALSWLPWRWRFCAGK